MAKLSPLHVTGTGEPDGLVWRRWRELLEAEGYARAVQLLTDGLQAPEGPEYEEMTAHDWLNEARAFDATGGTLDDWLLHIGNLSTKAHPAEACIHVMTFHKSKGLEYDAVFLPFSGSNALYGRGVPFFEKVEYQKDQAQVTGMVLNPGVNDETVPESPYHKLIKCGREKLMKEALHVLYVAVTRAKRANYILLNPKANAGSYSKLISDALAMDDSSQELEWGVKDWIDSVPTRKKALPVNERVTLTPPVERRKKSTPSREADSPSNTESGASRVYLEAAQFGTDVHALFEQIEWLDAARLPDWVTHPKSPEENLVANALNEPSVRALFTRREGLSVYREQGIESIRHQKGADVWVSGTIDRLILTEADGQVTDAHVIDFKTDIRLGASPEEQFSRLREKHRTQLNAYCELIAQMFPNALVHATIVSCPSNGDVAIALSTKCAKPGTASGVSGRDVQEQRM